MTVCKLIVLRDLILGTITFLLQFLCDIASLEVLRRIDEKVLLPVTS